jgi:hypothetical protein
LPASPDPSAAAGAARTWRALAWTPAARWFLLAWLAAVAIGCWLAIQPAHALADVTHYKLWARLATTDGIQASYSGEYPERYAIYPPVALYGLSVLGHLYRGLVDPAFELQRALASQGLTTAIRLMALGLHLVLGVVLFALLGRWVAPTAGLVGASLYLLNPGALWDVAVWAQPDPWHSLFALLGLWSIGRARPDVGGAWLGLAAMTKPQAWAVLPIAGIALLRAGEPVRALLRAGLAGSAVVLLVLAPFLLSGRLHEFLTLPRHIGGVMPVASANAHNLWWLATRGEFPFVLDTAPVLGSLPFSYRAAALALFAALVGFIAWRAWFARGPWELAELAAYFVHAWFCVTVQAHENHPFMLFPFLCLIWWRSPFLFVILLLLITTFSFNVLAHDFGLAPHFDEALGRWNWRLQMVASALNLIILGSWTIRLVAAGRSRTAWGIYREPT